MSLPNKDRLKAQQQPLATQHQTDVALLTSQLEAAVLANNWSPKTRGYDQAVIDEVIANFAKQNYTVVLVHKARNICSFNVS